MKILSWNVNGLRSNISKGFIERVNELSPDIICVQETKMQKGQAEVDLPDYEEYWNNADKKGYSGTAVFTKLKPLDFALGMGIDQHDREGRLITLFFDNFILVNVYTPNSQKELKRINYRMSWEDDFREYLSELDKINPVIIGGDLNVAHNEIDIKNPDTNRNSAGFSDYERSKMSDLLDSGFTDTFRFLYPDKTDAYTWWSPWANSRERNVGWRLDYFLVSDRLNSIVVDSLIHPGIFGSDHCPVELIISIN